MECESDHIEEPIVIVSCTDSLQEPNRTVLPATIFQILHAEHSSDEDVFLIDGKKVGLVSITAQVVSVEERVTDCKFLLDDGTGRISVLRTLVSVQTRQSPEKEQNEKDAFTALVGSFVGITAKFKTYKKHFLLDLPVEIEVHMVLDYHEVIFHILNAMHAHMSRICNTPPPNSRGALGNSVDLIGSTSGPHESAPPVVEGVGRAPGVSLTPDLDVEVQAHRLASLVLDKGREDWEHSQHTSVLVVASSILQVVHELGGSSSNRLVSLPDIQEALHNCSEEEFVDAIYYLLDEAYLTSPLDNGYVMITPGD
ncbi:hypothetical protein EDD16DRAFT_675591 [Pisolithus croceorrhizus]|nr:hypothetical protein F5141DRAFT_1114900 [Pisolithus sp. B1]KAI6132182.1 hypothetical protein EDD16DRAFT_675591 [Pisolithus croceorrhizus]